MKNKATSRRQNGVISCGKRTDFGYLKDFDQRYSIGKLLGHGQFGYTYVATDKANGDRVAVKKIDKNKVFFVSFITQFLKSMSSFFDYSVLEVALILLTSTIANLCLLIPCIIKCKLWIIHI